MQLQCRQHRFEQSVISDAVMIDQINRSIRTGIRSLDEQCGRAFDDQPDHFSFLAFTVATFGALPAIASRPLISLQCGAMKIELTEDEVTLIVRALEQYHAYLVSQQ